MRKMRKSLSFVLILALVLGSFSMAFANETRLTGSGVNLSDIAGILGEEEIEVCVNLGIITGNPDGTYQPDKVVNRAEFAAIVTRAMGIPESALAGYSTTSFQDTSGYGWAVPYLAFCQSKGIMLGDGQGNAMPGRTITVNEAITMISRALGYIEISAELVGAWPANYITLGQRLGLYEKVDRNEVHMTKEMAAIAMYNGLTVQLVAVSSDGRTVPVDITSGPNRGQPAYLLTANLECTLDRDQVLGSGYYSATLIGITERLGAYGDAFVNKDGFLIAFKMHSDHALLTGYIDGSDFIATDGRTYTFAQNAAAVRTALVTGSAFDNGLRIPGLASVLNGVYAEAAEVIEHFGSFYDGDAVTISARVTGNTIRNVRAAVGWAADRAVLATEGQVRNMVNNQSVFGYDFELDFDGEIDDKQFALVGVGSLSSIEEDNVLYVYANANDVIRKIAVGTEVVEGTIQQLNSDHIRIEGKDYDYADEFLILANSDATPYADIQDHVGADAVVSLDAYSNAFDIDTSGGNPGLFGVRIGGEAQPGSGLNAARLRILDLDDAKKTYEFASTSKIKVFQSSNNTKNVDANSSGSQVLINSIGDASHTDLAGPGFSLLGYRVNTDGDLNWINLPIVSQAGMELRSKALLAIGGTTYRINADTAVFTYDSDETSIGGIAYNARGLDDIELSSMADIDMTKAARQPFVGELIRDVHDKNKVVAMMIPSYFVESKTDDVFGVLNDVMYSTDSAGDPIDRYTVRLVGSTLRSLDTTADDTGLLAPSDRTFVNLYTFTMNTSDKVTDVNGWLGAVDNTDDAVDLVAVDTTPAGDGATVITGGGVSRNGYIEVLSDATNLNSAPTEIPFDRNVVVFKATLKSGNYSYVESSVGSISKDGTRVWMFDTKGEDDYDGSATIIIFFEP